MPIPARGAPNVTGVVRFGSARRVDGVLTPIVIDDVHPRTPAGFAAKAVVGEDVAVSATLIADGHDVLAARVRWRRVGRRRGAARR